MSWSETRRFYADRAYNDRRFGIAASSLQLALYADGISRRSKPDIIKGRIWALREIDTSTVNKLEGGQELEPEDRPTLVAALQELTNYLKTDQNDANLWNSKGMWEYELNRVNDAIISLKKALELKQWSKPYGNLARCYAEAGDFQEARNCSEQCSRSASNESEKRFSQKVSQFLDQQENKTETATKGSIEDIYEFRKKVWYQIAITEISQLGVPISSMPKAIERVVPVKKNLTEEQMADILSLFTPWVLSISWMNDREQKNLTIETIQILSIVASGSQDADIVAKSACWLLALWILTQNTIRSSKKRLEILKEKVSPQVLGSVSEVMEKIVPGIIQHFHSEISVESTVATPFQLKWKQGLFSFFTNKKIKAMRNKYNDPDSDWQICFEILSDMRDQDPEFFANDIMNALWDRRINIQSCAIRSIERICQDAQRQKNEFAGQKIQAAYKPALTRLFEILETDNDGKIEAYYALEKLDEDRLLQYVKNLLHTPATNRYIFRESGLLLLKHDDQHGLYLGTSVEHSEMIGRWLRSLENLKEGEIPIDTDVLIWAATQKDSKVRDSVYRVINGLAGNWIINKLNSEQKNKIIKAIDTSIATFADDDSISSDALAKIKEKLQ